MEFNAQSRLYIDDHGNHHIQIFDQDGNLLKIYKQVNRVSGLLIRGDNTLYRIGRGQASELTDRRAYRAGREDRVAAFISPHRHNIRVLQAGAGDCHLYTTEGPDSRTTAGGEISK